MKIRSFDHCAIQVRDLEEAVAFYRDVLGLTVREEDSNLATRVGKSVWFDLGDKQLHISVGAHPEAKGQHFGLEVDDVEAVAKELALHGMEVPERTVRGEGAGRRRYLKVSDPTGNLIELFSREG